MTGEKQGARVLALLRHRVAWAVALAVVICLAGTGIAVASRYQPIELDVGPTPPVVVDAHGLPVAGLVKFRA